MRQLFMLAVLFIVMILPAKTKAEGLIHQLPKDGSWVRFEVNGKGLAADGTVRISIKGTQTISSVGRVSINNEQCRWIEIESEMNFDRAGKKTAKFTEFFKLLIPEQYLTKGKNPRDHVLKAYKGSSAKTIRELDLKGKDSREIQSMDEMFHAPLNQESPLPVITIKTSQKVWTCKGIKSETKSGGTIFRTETRMNENTPFGVVTYKYENERRQNNISQGMRTMEWKFIESGENYKSAASDAK
jgi:hypothetical protein